MKTIKILGIRGVPAAHGGFETFAEHLALYLVAKGWRVVVYCQNDDDEEWREDVWQGVERIHVPAKMRGVAGTIEFDLKSTLHAAKTTDLCLTLGYNTAIFCTWLKIKGVPNIINMDGIEWARAKWGAVAKFWFWINERFGCWLGDRLIADHPEIESHLSTRVSGQKIKMIPYGAEKIKQADVELLSKWNLRPYEFLTVIARPEPENSILEIVSGFSDRPRNCKLVVLGNYRLDNEYHKKVINAAGPDVVFLGAVYDKKFLRALRFFSRAYIHGHRVGGTNPSLVEALGAGNPIIAHNNKFNRWVAGEDALYFDGADDISSLIDGVIGDETRLADMRVSSLKRFSEGLTWEAVLLAYELEFEQFLSRGVVSGTKDESKKSATV